MSSYRSSADVERHTPGTFPSSGAPAPPPQSLVHAVHARRTEYTRPRKIRIKVGSWNVASFKGTEKDLGGWFVGGKGVAHSIDGLEDPELEQLESAQEQERRRTKTRSTLPKNDHGSLPGGEDIDIYALGLQEVVDINSATEALRPFTDPSVANKYKHYLRAALPPGYTLVAEQQLIGLLLLVYASPRIHDSISCVSTTSVGTGLMGYMGNKGAVTARLVLGETTRLVFINCHLSAGSDKGAAERRNWDAAQILARTKFESVPDPTTQMQSGWEAIGDADFAFWLGDLNYRIVDVPGEDVRRILGLHIRNEYGVEEQLHHGGHSHNHDHYLGRAASRRWHAENAGPRSSTDSSVSSASSSFSPKSDVLSPSILSMRATPDTDPEMDPASLQTAISSLLHHDELYQQQQARKAFHDGWREGPITFLPTYKYDVGTVGVLDSSEKRRAPSWTDRILYRTRRDKLAYESRVLAEKASRKKDDEMKANGVNAAADDEDLLFEYNPETDAEEAAGDYDEHADVPPEVVVTKDGFHDELQLDCYTAHHRVLSSDHKPLDAVFTLEYKSIDPELKAKIQQEVAREFDKAENEGRPAVTVVVDKYHHHDEEADDDEANFEGVDFHNVKFHHAKRRSITIANTGQCPAAFGFIERPVGRGQTPGIAPTWLSLRFDRGPNEAKGEPPLYDCYSLAPGDTCNVELVLKVTDIEQVRELNEGIQILDDILVLRVTNGRDHFIPTRGRWLRTTFGMSMDKLTRVPEGGIRMLQRQHPSDVPKRHRGTSSSDVELGVKWSAPRELFRLTESLEALVERTIAEWGMTHPADGEKAPWELNAGWPFAEESWSLRDESERETLLVETREALDTDTPFDHHFPPETMLTHRLEILAECLLAFLDSLDGGIISETLWKDLENGLAAREKAKKNLTSEDERSLVLDTLSSNPNSSVSFILLTSTLSRIVNEISSQSRKSATAKETLPASSRATVRRKTLDGDAVVARRQLVEKNYACIFAEVLVKAPLPARDKERKAALERRRHVIEIFLRGPQSRLR